MDTRIGKFEEKIKDLTRVVNELKTQQLAIIRLLDEMRNDQRIIEAVQNQSRQVEALFALYSMVSFKALAPSMMTEWAVSPDCAAILVSLVLHEEPECVVELGSGASTIIIANCLKQIGKGKIISFESNNNCHEIASRHLHYHGLSDFVELVHAPLKPLAIKQGKWEWYDQEVVRSRTTSKIDFLLVDGPAGRLQTRSRYPALPILFDKLNDRSLIILDDFHRDDEQETARLWVNEFPGLKLFPNMDFLFPTERGLAVIEKTS